VVYWGSPASEKERPGEARVANYILAIWFPGNAAHSFGDLAKAFMGSAWGEKTAIGRVSLYSELYNVIAGPLRDGTLTWSEDDMLTANWSCR
jgi:hypothetical protein